MEKVPGFVPYKFLDLKCYASTEWLAEGKKKYRRVFESAELTYVYTEFSFYNKLFDESDWDVKVNLKCHELSPEGLRVKEICRSSRSLKSFRSCRGRSASACVCSATCWPDTSS